MEKDRTAKMIIILGYNGTGKSTLSKKFVVSALKNKERVLIVTPDDLEWPQVDMVHPNYPYHLKTYTGARKIIYEKATKNKPGTLDLINEYFDNGLLVFDDCRAYFTSNVDEDLHRLMIRRRQKMLDIIAVGHGFTEVPPKFYTFASDIALFMTKDNIERRKDVLRNFEQMKQAQTFVNKKAENNIHFYKIFPQI